MNKYVYNLVIRLNKSSNSDVNYLCKDNFIHIRLRDFGNKKEIISGLEDKLTFYVVWTLNKSLSQYLEEDISKITNKDKYDELWNKVMNKYYESFEFQFINSILQIHYPNMKGIKILPRYSKKDDYKTVLSKFGTIVGDQILFENSDIITRTLLDENVSIVIDKDRDVNCIKYIKKYANKTVSLWE